MQPYAYTICIGSLTSILRSLKKTLKEEEVNKDFTDTEMVDVKESAAEKVESEKLKG